MFWMKLLFLGIKLDTYTPAFNRGGFKAQEQHGNSNK